ncbi:MAG: amidohydrolase [Bacilli bacterium]|nr:amidohydrolase [Bacilli bacterium]
MKILLKNARILTLKNDKIIDGDILIENNLIVKIQKKIVSSVDKIIDCKKNVLMPGFKNAHSHSAMTFLRSYADDLPLDEWLQKIVFPTEKNLREEDVYYLSKLAFLEYISSGITACFDMYYFPDAIKKASNDIGMRTVVLFLLENPNVKFNRIKEKMFLYNNDNDNVTALLGFHSEYLTSKKQLEKIRVFAKKLKTPLYTHCCETSKEVEGSLQRHGLTPVQFFEKINIFEHGGGIFHGVFLNKKDMEILGKRNVFVCTCPCSNLKLSSGIAEVKQLLKNKVNVAIGTDGPASNNGLDMFREMYLVSVLSKYKERDPASISAFEILKMATVNGAKMLGLQKSLYLEEGSFADIIMLDIKQPDMQPVNDIIKNIVYSGNKLDIKMTMINGKILYYNKKFYLSENVNQIYKKCQKITDNLKKMVKIKNC